MGIIIAVIVLLCIFAVIVLKLLFDRRKNRRQQRQQPAHPLLEDTQNIVAKRATGSEYADVSRVNEQNADSQKTVYSNSQMEGSNSAPYANVPKFGIGKNNDNNSKQYASAHLVSDSGTRDRHYDDLKSVQSAYGQQQPSPTPKKAQTQYEDLNRVAGSVLFSNNNSTQVYANSSELSVADVEKDRESNYANIPSDVFKPFAH
jgi:hypothetical protein